MGLIFLKNIPKIIKINDLWCLDAKQPKFHESKIFATFALYFMTPKISKNRHFRWKMCAVRRLNVKIPLCKAARLPRYLTTTLPDVYMWGTKAPGSLASWCQDVRFLRARGHLVELVRFSPPDPGPQNHQNSSFQLKFSIEVDGHHFKGNPWDDRCNWNLNSI